MEDHSRYQKFLGFGILKFREPVITYEYGSSRRGIVAPMTGSTHEEIERLHTQLAAIYRLGRLTSTEDLAAQGLWARIERLQMAEVAATVKESKYRDALIAARAKEALV